MDFSFYIAKRYFKSRNSLNTLLLFLISALRYILPVLIIISYILIFFVLTDVTLVKIVLTSIFAITLYLGRRIKFPESIHKKSMLYFLLKVLLALVIITLVFYILSLDENLRSTYSPVLPFSVYVLSLLEIVIHMLPSKRKRIQLSNAINIITFISVGGVTIGALALIVVLSVFNGFDSLVRSLFNAFNPDLKITMVEGKAFVPDSSKMLQIQNLPGVELMAYSLEDKALLKYAEKQTIATIKGVSDSYHLVTGIDTMVVEGKYKFKEKNVSYGVIGQGIQYYLGIGIDFVDPLYIYVPKRMKRVSLNPERAINRKFIFPAGIFSVEKDFDVKYVLVDMNFARELFNYTHEISAVEIRLNTKENKEVTQQKIEDILGNNYAVKNRYQQNEIFYKTMQTEKWAIFLILTFILIVASFNVIASLTMIILEKKNDIATLRNMGANLKTIKQIFLYEGMLISTVGAIAGLLLGLFICWLQIHYKLVKIQSSGTLIIDAYPVQIQWPDILFVFLTVLAIGFIAAWFPVRFITKRYLTEL